MPPIVVGVDRSDDSSAALGTALQLAGRLGVPVGVVHAVGLLEASGYRAAPAVEEMVAANSAATGSAAQVTVERIDGPAAEALVRVAQDRDAAMVVVGRRGLGGAPRPLGSVSEAVLAHATCPVLVVPSEAVTGGS